MTAARRRTPSTKIEDRLVAAAFHLLEAEGPEALSIRRVAAEAGVAPMGVYNHFEGGKNGVVDAIFKAGFATLTAELGDVTDRTADDDPVEALRGGLRRYRRLALDHPRTYEVMFFCSIPGYEPSDEAHELAASSFDVLVQSIERGIRAGALAEADPRSVAQQMWSACHGAVALEITDICVVDDMERNYEALLDTLLRGISAPAGPSGPSGPSGSPARAARPARAR
jgi:AcrR family transcriptional regulator